MAETSSRTLTCGVLFAELADFSRLPLGEQMKRKRLLAAQVAQEVVQVPKAERVVHEIDSGVVVAFLGDAEAALAVAIGLQAAAGAPPLRMGINLGTVHVIKDLNGQTALVGEGVNDAQRVASHAAAGQALASGGYREVVSSLSAEHAAVFRIVALRSDASGREHELFEVRIPGKAAQPPPARAVNEAASVFDAGPHLIISGYERGVVQRALDEMAAKGANIISPITHVGDKWMASCEHPEVRMSELKVEKFGLTTVVTGPTRQAVERKVEELVERGARLQGAIEQDGDAWTAVCDSSGAGG
jgi:class 3 adenylate cyclase